MPSISSEQIRDISIRAVEDFLNNKVPLSVGLAKQASAAELNPEQLQRAVEATNSIAYLKVLQLSDDRTVEFPLAKYAEVMGSVVTPQFTEKQASAAQTPAMEKAASAPTAEPEFKLSLKERTVLFIKEAAANKEALARAEIESLNVKETLLKTASAIKMDPAWMDKLACVTDKQEFSELSVLLSGKVQPYRDLKDVGLFKEAQLKSFQDFSGLYKQARQLAREMSERSQLQKKADDVSGAAKNSFAAHASRATTGAAEFAGKGFGKPLRAVANLPFQAAKAVAKGVAGKVGKGLDAAAKGKEPLGIVGSAKVIGGMAGKALNTGFLGASAIGTAAAYDPGREQTTGRSNDAWTALQEE